MRGASLLLLVVLGQTPGEGAAALVGRLGSGRFVEREEAAQALERLGRQALPALRAARDAKDPEVRARSAALLSRIETALVVEPTLLRLDFEDVPLPEIVESLGRQAGIKFALLPDNRALWEGRRVSLKAADPVPFWRVIDTLCEAAGLQANPGMSSYGRGRETTFPLFEGGTRPTAPVSDSGPFRVTVIGLHFQRDVNFPPVAPGGANPPRGGVGRAPARALRPDGSVGGAFSEQFFVQLQVAAEPQLTLSQTGSVKGLEARDELGQDLADRASESGPLAERSAGYLGLANGSVVQVQTSLARPEKPGKRLAVFKGVIPALVSLRKGQPLALNLTDLSVRTTTNEEGSLTLHELKHTPNRRQVALDLSIRIKAQSGPHVAPESALPQGDTLQQQVEVLDAEGKPLPWYQTSFDPENGRMTLTVSALGAEPVVPAEVRLHGLTRAAADIPFAFQDVTLPLP